MKASNWIGFGALTMIIGSIFGSITLEMARPGKVLCPLRRICEKWDIPLEKIIPDSWRELSADENRMARESALAWREESLRKYPNLHVEAKNVPPEQNGYWQLSHLEKHPIQPDSELVKLLKSFDDNDFKTNSEEIKDLLALNEPWMEHISMIASLEKSSNQNLPETVHFISPKPSLNACRSILLASLGSTYSGDEEAAIRHFHTSGRLVTHLQAIEAPTFNSEIAVVWMHRNRCRFLFEQLLPSVGTQADIAKWQMALGQPLHSPSRIADLIRGEWHHVADSNFAEMIWATHYERRLPDPDALANAFSDEASLRITVSSKSAQYQLPSDWESKRTKIKLSPEADEFLSMMGFSDRSLFEGFHQYAREFSIHLAALELLTREQKHGSISAKDTNQVTHDPITQRPFEYDAASGILLPPANAQPASWEIKVQLPWRAR